MASNTTYGDWMRKIPGGLRNIGKPLTVAAFGVLVVTLIVSMVNVPAAIAVFAIGAGTVMVLARRDREHRNVVDRQAERQAWSSARRSGRGLYRSGLLAPVPGGETRLPGILSQVSLVEALDGFGRPFTLVHHGHTGEFSLPLRCRPQGAALVDDDVEDAYVAGWAGLLESLASETGVVQLAATVDTSPDSGMAFRRTLSKHVVDDAPDLAARAMAQVMDQYGSGGARSEVILTLTFRFRDARGRFLDDEEAARRVALMLPGLTGQIAGAGGGSPKPCRMDELALMTRTAYDPAVQDTVDSADTPPSVAWEDAGPVAAEAGWDCYRHDSGLSRSWEMCDPPRSSVTADTLARLLAPLDDCDRKRVTVLLRMLPDDQTQFLSEQNRQRAAGQVSQEKHATVSSASQMGKAERQAIETNRGAVMVFFGLLATATVRCGEGEADRLEAAARSVEQAAGASKIDLRCCWGAQDTAFAASLPLGITQESYRPPSVLAALR